MDDTLLDSQLTYVMGILFTVGSAIALSVGFFIVARLARCAVNGPPRARVVNHNDYIVKHGNIDQKITARGKKYGRYASGPWS